MKRSKKQWSGNIYNLRTWMSGKKKRVIFKRMYERIKFNNVDMYYVKMSHAMLMQNKGELLFSREISKTSRVYHVLREDELKKFFEKNLGSQHFHEVISPKNQMCLIIDLDFKYDGSNAGYFKVCKEAQQALINGVDKKEGLKINWTILDSSNTVKFSRHLITKDIMFNSVDDMGEYVASILASLTRRGYYSQKIEMIYKMLDLAIYRQNSTMRCYNSSKYGTNRKLVNYGDNGSAFKFEVLKGSLITGFFKNFVSPKKFDQKIPFKKRETYKKMAKLAISCRYMSPTPIIKRVSNFEINVSNTVKKELNNSSTLRNYLKREITCSKYEIKKIFGHFVGDKVVFLSADLTGKYCPIKKGTHSNNGRSIFVRVPQMTMSLKCGFNQTCKESKKREYFRLGNRLLEILKVKMGIEIYFEQ